MNSGILVRLMEPGDVAAMAAIEAAVSREPWSHDLFAGELGVPPSNRHWLVAEDDRAIIGFGGMMYVEDEAHVMNLAVASTHHRTGTARRLLGDLITEARRRGTQSLTLEVRPDNEPAVALYRQFGFAPVGVRPDYYVDGAEALIMWVHDVDTDAYLTVLDRAREASS